MMASLQEYFDVVLGDQLLYDFEKPQHSEILASYPTRLMSQIYGGAHLLRLFPQMGPMLACTPLNNSSLDVLQNHLQNFLQYLALDPSRLFSASTDYQEASADYQQKAGGPDSQQPLLGRSV
ncbi:mortality factor 4-like protein 2 [Vombatus ursinus]|uniref:mortality factor 4-like protein 2 n=1 Tax=Vombatus ursinus TaxID=29139 RepID=UPI000FFD177C|nr:mortality factor 4-like protein 2 [Vombatus ursinus]